MTPLEAALVDVVSALESRSLPYMLVGGLAIALWGEPRATLDIDVVLWVEPDNLGETIRFLSGHFRSLPKDTAGFVRQNRVLPVETPRGVRADFVFATLPYEKQAIARASAKQVAGRNVSVASVEDLVLMKLLSERERDLNDVHRLLRRFGPSVDREYLEPLLGELAATLGRPGIVAEFHRGLRK